MISVSLSWKINSMLQLQSSQIPIICSLIYYDAIIHQIWLWLWQLDVKIDVFVAWWEFNFRDCRHQWNFKYNNAVCQLGSFPPQALILYFSNFPHFAVISGCSYNTPTYIKESNLVVGMNLATQINYSF